MVWVRRTARTIRLCIIQRRTGLGIQQTPVVASRRSVPTVVAMVAATLILQVVAEPEVEEAVLPRRQRRR